MRRVILFALLLTAWMDISCSRRENMDDLTARVFKRAATQMLLLDANLDSAAYEVGEALLYPRSLNPDGTLMTSNNRWWCSGFYPGSLWYIHEYTQDERFKELALKYQVGLESLRFRTDDHDVGFQLMCSYGNCLRITATEECIPIIIDGANSLATRFNKKVGCTRSWSFGKWSYPVIVDNMMNMELLLKASELGGDDSLKVIAIEHSRTTMKNHFREDYSSYHLVDYNPETGEVVGKQTVQGYADDSAWSRGQAWALYGYSMVYRFTRDDGFLNHAIAIAEYIIPRLPDDGVPYWDFDSPEIPNDIKDASAGAIIASGLIELSTYVDIHKSKRYLNVAEKILRSLASEKYLAEEGEICGFLLKHSTGNKAGDSEVDVPLTYADYYFLEALLRYNKLK